MPFQLTDELQKVDEKLKVTEALLESKVWIWLLLLPQGFFRLKFFLCGN